MTDAVLIVEFLQGDEGALGALMARHRGSLMGFFGRRVGDDAEELHQELWTRVTRSLQQYQEEGNFRAYLFTTARRLVIDHHRRRAARPVLLALEADPGVAARDEVCYRELLDTVDEALASMSPAMAEVLRLRLGEQVPFREIAELQGAPLNTVLSHMHRGLRLLRKQLIARGLVEEDERHAVSAR